MKRKKELEMRGIYREREDAGLEEIWQFAFEDNS